MIAVAFLAAACVPAAPYAPGQLSVRTLDSRVGLTWPAVPGAAGYFVYMAESPEGPWEKVNSAPLLQAQLVVDGLENLRAYHFFVTSVDEEGQESAGSFAVRAIPTAPGAGRGKPPTAKAPRPDVVPPGAGAAAPPPGVAVGPPAAGAPPANGPPSDRRGRWGRRSDWDTPARAEAGAASRSGAPAPDAGPRRPVGVRLWALPLGLELFSGGDTIYLGDAGDPAQTIGYGAAGYAGAAGGGYEGAICAYAALGFSAGGGTTTVAATGQAGRTETMTTSGMTFDLVGGYPFLRGEPMLLWTGPAYVFLYRSVTLGADDPLRWDDAVHGLGLACGLRAALAEKLALHARLAVLPLGFGRRAVTYGDVVDALPSLSGFLRASAEAGVLYRLTDWMELDAQVRLDFHTYRFSRTVTYDFGFASITLTEAYRRTAFVPSAVAGARFTF